MRPAYWVVSIWGIQRAQCPISKFGKGRVLCCISYFPPLFYVQNGKGYHKGAVWTGKCLKVVLARPAAQIHVVIIIW